MSFFLDDGIGPGKTMDDATILDIGARTHFDAAEIAAQRRAWPDVTIRAHDDVADQHRAGMDESARIDDRRYSIDRPDFHAHVRPFRSQKSEDRRQSNVHEYCVVSHLSS